MGSAGQREVPHPLRTTGAWSTKTVTGMGLVVSGETIEIGFRNRVLQTLLKTKWVFEAPRTSGEVSGEPSPRLLSRSWIVLARLGREPSGSVAIFRAGAMEAIWDALMEAGAIPVSAPPRE